mmetsp:Transcript_17736/g.40618  ORF Transcript_17736/g.40618 Transcript_17736/m.40618 type:complete len:257 (+) Transcript_17736:5575-6345(+)
MMSTCRPSASWYSPNVSWSAGIVGVQSSLSPNLSVQGRSVSQRENDLTRSCASLLAKGLISTKLFGGGDGSAGGAGNVGGNGGGGDGGGGAGHCAKYSVSNGANVIPCVVYGSIPVPWNALYRRGTSFCPDASFVSRSAATSTLSPADHPFLGCMRTSNTPSPKALAFAKADDAPSTPLRSAAAGPPAEKLSSVPIRALELSSMSTSTSTRVATIIPLVSGRITRTRTTMSSLAPSSEGCCTRVALDKKRYFLATA